MSGSAPTDPACGWAAVGTGVGMSTALALAITTPGSCH